MAILIISLLLSVVVAVGSAIFMRKQKTYYKAGNLTNKRNVKKVKKTIKNLWEIEAIENNIISLENNMQSIIVELAGIDYYLLNNDEQLNVDEGLENIARMLKYNMQFFVTTDKIDINNRIEEINNNTNNNKNSKIKEYAEKHIEYLNRITSNQKKLAKRNYMIISTFDKPEIAAKDLKKFYENLKYNLLNVNVYSRIISNKENIDLIHKELCGINESHIEKIIERGGLDTYVT